MKKTPSGFGPLTWLTTIVITTLLLVAATKALWLVVPFLLAIILYYLLYPIVLRLILGGVAREAAAALVAGGVTVLAVAIMIPLVPWLIAQSVSGEETLFRYLEGGRVLIDRTLLALESQFAFLKRLDFHAEMSRKATEFGNVFVQKQLADALNGAATWLPSLLLAPFFAFFFLRDGRQFVTLLLNEVPNAFFERTIYMVDRVNATARNYFQGLLKLTVIDSLLLAFGLWLIGIPGALLLGVIAAIFEWVPVVGMILGCVLVVLVAAADFPNDPWVVYAVVALFVAVRMLDNFLFIPLTIGRSIQMHPLPTVLMVFIGGAVAGVAGLILALPLAGVVSAVVGTAAGIVYDPRLRARNRFAKALQLRRATADLSP
ncbi:MAG: AI-2E family transporter [Burkholderiales bacterium]|nr:AI-2E family transporter [Burkholderiales bacterium]